MRENIKAIIQQHEIIISYIYNLFKRNKTRLGAIY